jgi:hypothetical protein
MDSDNDDWLRPQQVEWDYGSPVSKRAILRRNRVCYLNLVGLDEHGRRIRYHRTDVESNDCDMTR